MTESLNKEGTDLRSAIPVPASPATATFSALAPAVRPPQNPDVNDASFFGAATLATTVVPLSWPAPAGRAPDGDTVCVYGQTTLDGVATHAETGGTLSTAATSVNLPPLAGGNAYIFSITSEADGTANVQTSPFRPSLPLGFATVVSAPFTISSGALMPDIHGDRRITNRLLRPRLPPTKR